MYTETMTHKITHRICGTQSSFDIVDERLDIYSGLWGIRFRFKKEEKTNCMKKKNKRKLKAQVYSTYPANPNSFMALANQFNVSAWFLGFF